MVGVLYQLLGTQETVCIHPHILYKLRLFPNDVDLLRIAVSRILTPKQIIVQFSSSVTRKPFRSSRTTLLQTSTPSSAVRSTTNSARYVASMTKNHTSLLTMLRSLSRISTIILIKLGMKKLALHLARRSPLLTNFLMAKVY